MKKGRIKIGPRLSELLEEQHLKQIDLIQKAEPLLAERGMKLSPSKLSQYVSDTHGPDSDMIELLAEVLHVDVAWLLGLTDKRMPAPANGDGLEMKLSSLSPGLLEKFDRFLELAKADPETAERFLSFAVQELESSQQGR